MTKWTESKLIKEGYEIQNALITKVDLSMADHGCLVLELTLEGGGWGVVFGGEVIGKGYVGAKDDYWEGYESGIEYIMRIMDIAKCERLNDLKNKYIRVAHKGWGSSVKIIGNILSDRWFDAESFFADKVQKEGMENQVG